MENEHTERDDWDGGGGLKPDGEKWWMNEIWNAERKKKTGDRKEMRQKGEAAAELINISSGWISFTLIEALVDKVAWDYLNQDTHRERKKGKERARRREEGDKETGSEREGVMSY